MNTRNLTTLTVAVAAVLYLVIAWTPATGADESSDHYVVAEQNPIGDCFKLMLGAFYQIAASTGQAGACSGSTCPVPK